MRLFIEIAAVLGFLGGLIYVALQNPGLGLVLLMAAIAMAFIAPPFPPKQSKSKGGR